jgi:hypothetical protein
MRRIKKKLDLLLLTLMITIVVGLPFGIRAYDHEVNPLEPKSLPLPETLNGAG